MRATLESIAQPEKISTPGHKKARKTKIKKSAHKAPLPFISTKFRIQEPELGLNYVNKVEHRFWVFVLAVFIPDSIPDPEHLKLRTGSCPPMRDRFARPE